MKIDEKLKNEIEEAFNIVQKNTKIDKRSGWTHAFFEELRRIGLKYKFKVYTSSVKDKIEEKCGGGEWLFDLCWSKEKIGDKKGWMINYEGLKLICESEWSMDEEEIIYDFQKLVVGKADIKLMIIQYKDKEQFLDIFAMVEKSINPILINDNENYFLIGSGNGDKDIIVKFKKLFKNLA